MNVKQLVGTILDTVIKIVIIAVVVTYTYRYAVQVYEFGYRISAEEPMSSAGSAAGKRDDQGCPAVLHTGVAVCLS